MASGAPVITSTMSSLPEVVGDAAMLVNPENVFDIARGIKEVLLDSSLRTRLIAAGRTHAAEIQLEAYRPAGFGNLSRDCEMKLRVIAGKKANRQRSAQGSSALAFAKH